MIRDGNALFQINRYSTFGSPGANNTCEWWICSENVRHELIERVRRRRGFNLAPNRALSVTKIAVGRAMFDLFGLLTFVVVCWMGVRRLKRSFAAKDNT